MKKKALSSMIVFGIILKTIAQIPTDSLVAYFPFNGNANDESGNGNNGTVYGATLTTDRFGNENSTYYFSGNDFIEVPDDATLDISGSLTLSLWYKHQGKMYDYARLLSKAWDTFGEPWLCYGLTLNNQDEYNQNVTSNAHLSSTEKTYCGSNTIFNHDEWYHICAVFDTLSKFSTIYINGKFDNQSAIVNKTIGVSNSNLQIGNDPNVYQGIVGSIDDIRIYSRVLNESEIKLLFNENRSLSVTSLISPPILYMIKDTVPITVEVENISKTDSLYDFTLHCSFLNNVNQLITISNSFSQFFNVSEKVEFTFDQKIDLSLLNDLTEMKIWLTREGYSSFDTLRYNIKFIDPGSNIIFITPDDRDNEQIEFIESFGFNIATFWTDFLSDADQNTIDMLNDVGLVIIGRSPSSSSFLTLDDKQAWNAITSPIILNSQWIARNTKLNWFNSSNAYHQNDGPDVAYAQVANINDPIFDNSKIDEDSISWCTPPHDFLAHTTATNGEILATYDSAVLVARFEPNVPFYPEAVDTSGGLRTYFGFGNDNTGTAYFFPLTNDARSVYINEIIRLYYADNNCSIIPPKTKDTTILYGEPIPELAADASDTVKWYSDIILDTLLHIGNTFQPDVTDVGVYKYFVTQKDTCESTPVITYLKIIYDTITNLNITICQGESIQIGDSIFTTTGNYSVTLPNEAGYEPIVNLDLTVNPVHLTELTDTICDYESIQIGDSIFTETGNYSVTLTNQYGCDSVVNLDLTVIPVDQTDLTETICEGENIQIGDSIFTESGNYSVTLTNQYGCDSIINLALNVNQNPNVALGADTTIYSSDKLILDAGDGFETYEWSNSKTTQTILVDSLEGIGEHTYSVLVSDNNNCFGSDTIIITIERTTGIISFSETIGVIKLYPNPSNGKINIEIENIQELINVLIYSETGQIVF